MLIKPIVNASQAGQPYQILVSVRIYDFIVFNHFNNLNPSTCMACLLWTHLSVVCLYVTSLMTSYAENNEENSTAKVNYYYLLSYLNLVTFANCVLLGIILGRNIQKTNKKT